MGKSRQMKTSPVRRVQRLSALVACVAVLFVLFFQVNKRGPLGDSNPSAKDPYDAVGSFAIQGAPLIALFTYARALRWCQDPAQANKARLILRGNGLVLAAIWITLIADWIAVATHAAPPLSWRMVLLLELELMSLLALFGAIALAVVLARTQTVPPPRDLTLADGIDDLWILVRIPVTRTAAFLPPGLVAWVNRFSSDRLFTRVPWMDPRVHPWRFACALGLLAGLALVLAQAQEGLPPTLAVGLIVAGIFIGGELVATLLGFAILGGYLGVRPGL
jgi:hypothetical protein